jgi:uncharacterized protein YjbI with pentapeptide repeats
LRGTDLRRAKFNNADLADADLSGSNLRQADLTGADLTGANLDGAELPGATLIDVVGLEQQRLNLACGNAETKVPAGFEVPSCRKRFVEEQVR